MRRSIRSLLLVLAVAATAFAPTAASAVEPCPAGVCVAIDGRVADPHGKPVPEYVVVAQRADGYNETATTGPDGRFAFRLPPTTSTNCYQVVGRSDPFYTVSNEPRKACTSTAITLRPKYRINGITGVQKTYFGDISRDMHVPVDVSALSRSFPAPFHDDPLPWVFAHRHPHDANGEEPAGEHIHHGARGFFPEPVVRKIADGVWQYVWKSVITLPGHEPGYYDMDWGRGTSVYSPMMDCRMIWYGYGVSGISPARSLPGRVVALTGQRLGSAPGRVVIKGSGQVTTIQGAGIVSWTNTRVEFVVPPTAKSGWVNVVPPSGVATNGQALHVGA